MRYYEINLYPPADTTNPILTWSSFHGGKFDPNALNVEFDCPIGPLAVPLGGAAIRIHGVPLNALMQGRNFGWHYVNGQLQEGCVLELKGGMGKGLPLATPSQSGTLLVGQIVQSFGQWEGTEMWLDFVVNATAHTLDNPANIVLNWKAGQPLSSALKECLKTAYPNMPTQVSISDNLIFGHDVIHYTPTLEGLGMLLKPLTEGVVSSAYPGVDMAINAGTISVFDGTQQTTPKQILATDLVGQPTWLDTKMMQLKVVLRGDIQIGQQIAMPKGFLNGPGSVINQTSVQSAITFSGNLFVTAVRHLGHFRSPNGADWVTILTCSPISGTANATT